MFDSRSQGTSPLPIKSTGHEMMIKVNPSDNDCQVSDLLRFCDCLLHLSSIRYISPK
jgi:hypothetical protein